MFPLDGYIEPEPFQLESEVFARLLGGVDEKLIRLELSVWQPRHPQFEGGKILDHCEAVAIRCAGKRFCDFTCLSRDYLEAQVFELDFRVEWLF